MKKIISIFISLLLVFSSLNVCATYLHVESTKEKTLGGITYEERKILLENDFIKAYIAYVDLTNPNICVKVMTASEGSSYLENVKDMATKNDTVIALNGDFFNMSSGQTNMLGMVMKDGELISTPALDHQASFVVTETNEVLMDYFSFTMNLISPQGYSTPMYEINKVPVVTGGITMLTPAWAEKSWGGENFKELVVENDVVKEIREPGSDAVQIPQNGYILVTNPAANAFFDYFKVGDPVKIDLKISPDITGFKEVTGGNTLLVDEGKLAKFTGIVTGYAQRSSVGITKDGKTLILAAVDGRETNCKGLTQYGMAELMISLGAYKAINLDGGGSTTFIKKDSNGNQQTMNSASWLRKVSTAIGIGSNNLAGTYAKSGELKSDKSTVFIGDTLTLSATFYDEYGNIFYPPISEIRYYDSLNQDIAGGKYTPMQAGMHTFYASYGDITVSTDVKVLDDVFSIEILNGDIDLSESSFANLTVYGYTEKDEKFIINPDLLEWTSSNDDISIKNGIVKLSKNVGGVISANLKGKTDYIVINKDLYNQKAPISQTGTDILYGLIDDAKTVSVSGALPKGKTLLDEFFARKRLDSLKAHTKAFIIDNYYKEEDLSNISDIFTHSTVFFDGTAFITISNPNGEVKPSELASIITSSANSQNIVVMANSSSDSLSESEKTIKSILSTLSKSGKNIFLVTSGEKTEVKLENGVRYITLGSVKDYHTSSYLKDADYCSYVKFSINGNEIKYEFVKDKIR